MLNKLNLNEYSIRKYVSDGPTFVKGKELFINNKISGIKLFDDGLHILAKIESDNGKEYISEIFFDDEGKIINDSCTCTASSAGICEHVVAELFYIMNDEQKELSNELSNSYIASRLLVNKFETKYYNPENLEGNHEIFKTPIFVKVNISLDESICLSFLFSKNDKKKPVKNLTLFASELEKYILSQQVYDVYLFINKFLDSITGSEKQFGINLTDYKNGDTIKLTKHLTDTFFDTFKSLPVFIRHECKSKTFTKLYFKENISESYFKIINVDEKIALQLINTNLILVKGEKFGYYFNDNIFARIDSIKYDVLFEIVEIFRKGETDKIEFYKEDINKFTGVIFPKLKEAGLLSDMDIAFVNSLIKFLKINAYFDLDNNAVECKVEFCYEDSVYNAFDNNLDGNFRNLGDEYNFKKLLISMGFVKDKNRYLLQNEEMIYKMFLEGFKKVDDVAEVFITDNLKRKSIRNLNSKSIGLRISGNLINIDLDFDDYIIENYDEILDSYKMKKKYHRLNDGSFISLENNEQNVSMKIADALNLSQKDAQNNNVSVSIPKALYLEKLLSNYEKKFLNRSKQYMNIVQTFENYNSADLPIPKNLNSILRDYQKTGFYWLEMLSDLSLGGILADDMGLGKTLQIITLLNYEYNNDKSFNSIIICPASLVFNWKEEFSKYSPEINTVIINGKANERKALLNSDIKGGVFITAYDTLKRDIELYADRNFKFVIADEAQYIKNPLTNNAKAVKKINGKTKFALTGTPIENSLTELWSIFDFVLPGYLYSSSEFQKMYSQPIVKENDLEASNKLKRQIAPFILRRVKNDVLSELPNKIENILYANMLEEQRDIYDAYLLKAKKEIEQSINDNTFNINRMKILALITRLRQICCHPNLFVDNYKGSSAKLDLTIDTALSLLKSGHRILLFSQFTSMLDIIADVLSKKNINYFYLDGSISSIERMRLVNEFNSGRGEIFLISLRAGGTGLNLTSADVVIHYDPWWNPAVMNQASDRVHRFGQKNIVNIFNIITKNSIEEKILELQNKKKDLINEIITEESSFINKLSQEDIINLFSI